MATEPLFQLKTRDHAILQAMLERHGGARGPFARLLERKVRTSAICFRDDIPADVVTLDTRLSYRVNGRPAGPHVIVQGEVDDLPDHAVSIRTIRGLALLGLSERACITVDLGRDVAEELCVEHILSQPEAEARLRATAHQLARGEEAGRTPNIVSFPRRPAPAAAFSPPDDDDPGPQAA